MRKCNAVPTKMINKRVFYGILLISCFAFVYWTFDDTLQSDLYYRSAQIFNKLMFFQNDKIPLVLLYTKFFGGSMMPSSEYYCPWKCNFTEDQSTYNIADAVLFHSRNANYDFTLSKSVNPLRLNVFYSMEASPNENIRGKHFPPDFFNVTMSFRRDSDIWQAYDKFESALPEDLGNPDVTWSDEAVNTVIAQKSKLAIQFVSNCNTHSGREFLVNELLNKTSDIDVFGHCNKQECNRTCENEILDSYYFYFAFENSVCKDYVTEKFWRLKRLIVPIVLKRSILQGILDDAYFLAVDDYKNMDEFIKDLNFYKENVEAYKKFFGWTKLYRKAPVGWQPLCSLCEFVYKPKPQKAISNIVRWWNDQKQCQHGFARRIWGL
uniref:Fucosyltransferase n=1 Tax=Panagrellus redivivus TaxID=6233 RepID=A0A7E4VUV8_PANRE